MKLQKTTFKAGSKIRLKDFDTRATSETAKEEAQETCEENSAAIGDLSYRLYAEDRRSLLISLQGMDTAGKDGTIRHIMRSVDAQATEVHPFKKPSAVELDHDFLWRIHQKVPARGNIGIFNRSHYEDVLVVRVHNLVPRKEWAVRYDRINDFEQHLADSGVMLLKFFLHISKEEQRERLQARLDNPNKRWKFSKADLSERQYWDDYQKAYTDALNKCNTSHAPWHIVCADRKWHRNLVISSIVRRTLEKMDPKFPPAEEGLESVIVE
jgi:PPK2 family polyphosphate:nucleotide phosphotransferase